MTNDPYLIISADTHAGADVLEYRPYLAARWHDDFDAWAPTVETEWSDLTGPDADRNWNSTRRLRELEADGIAAEVILPNTIPPFFPPSHLAGTLPASQSDYDRRWAGLQAHNRWLVDFCADAPNQRRGVIQVFPNNIDDAIAEIDWALEQPDLCGVLLPSIPPNSIEPLYVDTYNPIWARCQEAGLPILTHAGGGAPTLPDDPATLPILIYEYAMWSHRSLWHLVLGGVFERFPDLRFVPTEQGGPSWLARLSRALDEKFSTLIDPKKQTKNFDRVGLGALSMLPSEYIARNCWLGASFCQAHDAPYFEEVGVENVLWGADYPHNEGSTPFTREALRHTFSGVATDDVRAMVGLTAAELYGFDLDALRPIADRVGPSVTEIAEPLAEVPADSTSYAFHPEYIATY